MWLTYTVYNLSLPALTLCEETEKDKRLAISLPFCTHSYLYVKFPYPTTDLSGQTIIITGANTGLGITNIRLASPKAKCMVHL